MENIPEDIKAEVTELLEALVACEKDKKLILNKIASVKLEEGLKEKNEEIKDFQAKLYTLMKENAIEKIGKYTLAKLMPLDEKKTVREVEKKEKISSVLQGELKNTKKLDAVVDSILRV
jgi:hypothetical protein